MNYTSIEQSKKLLELGLSPESADMKYVPKGTYTSVQVRDFAVESNYVSPILSDEIPCWSVGALLKLIPSVGVKRVSTEVNLTINRGASWSWQIIWSIPQISRKYIEGNSLLDVVYKTIIWLLENNYIKTD